MILKNVEIRWAKLDKDNPDMGFDKSTPQWNLVAITRDKAQMEEWKAAGINAKPDTDDTGIFYKLTTKKLVEGKNGVNKPPAVVGPDLMPLTDEEGNSLIPSIGNGTVANVKLRTFEYNFNGRQGIGHRLDAVQIVKLVEYKAKKGAVAIEGFEAIDASDTSVDNDEAY